VCCQTRKQTKTKRRKRKRKWKRKAALSPLGRRGATPEGGWRVLA
jgi:hypothetical protein